MRKKMFSFKNFVMAFMAIGLLTSVGCRKQDDSNKEIEKLKEQIQTVKSDLEKKSKDLQANLDNALKSLKELQDKPAPETISKEELDKKIEEAKKSVLDAVVAKAAFETYKKEATKDLTTKLEAQKATLEALIGEKADGTKVTALEEELNKLKGLKLEDQIEALKNTISENKTELKNLLQVVDTKVANNADTIAEVDGKLEDLTAKFNELVQKFNSLDVTNVVNDLLSARLTSLVVLPDYVSAGGALPIVNFSALKTEECDLLQADNVTIKYVVNPSSVKLEDINVGGMKFRYNDPAVLTARKPQNLINPEVTSATLSEGVLTVGVKLNLAATWAATASNTNTENRIDQLMLVVPSKDGKTVVSSDWVRVAYKASEPAIVKYNTNFVLPVDPVEAKTATNTVVDMAYNDVLDLSMNVASKTKVGFTPIEHSNYKGLGYAFEIVENTVSGTIDNQAIKFVEGSTSTVTTKVYGDNLEKLEATIGSAPIVKVTLKSEDCDKVTEGYVKLNIVDAVVEDKEREVAPVEAEIIASCTDSDTTTTTVAEVTQEMLKEVYKETGKVGVTATKFHNDYMLQTVSSTMEVGTVSQVVEGGNYKVAYILTEKETWDNVGRTVEKTATYVNKKNLNNKVKMTFKVKVKKPTVTLDVLSDESWYNNSALSKSKNSSEVYNTVVHNVRVPLVNDINKDNAIYSTNINDAFKSLDKKFLDIDKNKYTYEYVFYSDNQPLDEHTYVADNGKTLKYRNMVVATISKTTEGDMLTYEDNDVAKELLNKGPEYAQARLRLVVKNLCGKELNVVVKNLQDGDKFKVIFLRPINVEGVSSENFINGVDFGTEGSFIDMKKIAKLSDWRNFVTRTNAYDFLPNHENYYKYYGVESIKVDIENIKTEGRSVGGTEVTTVPSNAEVKQTENNTNYKGEADNDFPYGVLTYKNTGSNLGETYTMILPVTVKYKWGEVRTEVRVKVRATKNAAAVVD